MTVEKLDEAIAEFEQRLKLIPYYTDGVKQTEVLLQAARSLKDIITALPKYADDEVRPAIREILKRDGWL